MTGGIYERYIDVRCVEVKGRGGNTRIGLREVFLVISREATPYVKKRAVGVIALVVAAALLTGLSPVALKLIVDALAGNGGHRSVALPVLVALYIVGLWLGRTAAEIRELIFARARERIFRTLTGRLFEHLMRLPLRYHLDRQTGAVSQTLDNGLEGLRIILHHAVFTYLPVTVELTTVVVVLARLATLPFLLLFCTALVCYVVVFTYSARTITNVARRASVARIDATAVVADALLNYETVKYFSAEALVQDRVDRALRRSESEWVDFYRAYARNGLVAATIFAGFLAGTVFLATAEAQRNRMTLGDFVLVNTYMLQVVRPLEMVGYAMQGLSHGVAMLEKLVQLLREPTEPRPGIGSGGVSGTGALEFRKVCLSYRSGRQVLRDVSFRVAPGHTVGIVGPSGSGKSTVVRLLMRLLEPESGVILLDDAVIADIDLTELRSLIAVVPQDTVLFADTVRYNIAVGRADATRDEIESAARIAQLHDFLMALPNGYDTVVGERGVKLSGGERQRIAIARAVLKSPKIYVFDEATSSLDSRTEREILRGLCRISRSNATLVIAHRLSTVVHADQIVVFESGQIVEYGTHEALLRRNGKYTALWIAQSEGAEEPGEIIGV